MSDVQRAAALGVFIALGGLALVDWAIGQDNPYTVADETAWVALGLGWIVTAVGLLAVAAAGIALVLGKRDLPKLPTRR